MTHYGGWRVFQWGRFTKKTRIEADSSLRPTAAADHQAMPTKTRSRGGPHARSSSPICSEETPTQEAPRQPLKKSSLNLHQVAHNQLSPPRQHPYRTRRRGDAASSSSPPAPLASPQGQATQLRPQPQNSPKHKEEQPFRCSRTASPDRSPISGYGTAPSTPAMSHRGEACSHAAPPGSSGSATQLGLVVSLADTSLSSLEAAQLASAPPGAGSDAGSVVCLCCEHGGSPLGNEILLCDGQAHPNYTN